MQHRDRDRQASLTSEVKLTQEQIDRANGMLTKAQEQLDEEHDDVKDMNTKMTFSKVITIRDKQLAENKALEREYMDEQKRLDIMMEIERLKQIKLENEREERKVNARKAGAQVIIDQISERHQIRIKEQEEKEKEALIMKKQADAMIREEEERIREKQMKAQKLLVDVETSNRLAMALKEKKRLEEKEMDDQIIKYNLEKAKREYEAQVRDQRIRDEKERELQKMREAQEKNTNRQEEIDAARAKRAFEDSEVQARLREQLNLEKKERLLKDLDAARQRQFADKENFLAQQAAHERDEFLNIIKSQKESQDKEKKIEEHKRAAFVKHRMELVEQIKMNEEKQKQDKLDYLEEGRKIRQKLADEVLKLETIKTNKLGQLEKMGIDKRYQVDLAAKKI